MQALQLLHGRQALPQGRPLPLRARPGGLARLARLRADVRVSRDGSLRQADFPKRKQNENQSTLLVELNGV